MGMLCESCGWTTRDERIAICPKCGLGMKFTLIMDHRSTLATGLYPGKAPWQEPAAGPAFKTVESPLAVRAGQLGAALALYLIVTWASIWLIGPHLEEVYKARGQAGVKEAIEFFFTLAPIPGFFFAGAVAGAGTISWRRQAAIVAGCVIPLLALIVRNLDYAALYLVTGLALTFLGAWIGRIVVHPPRILASARDIAAVPLSKRPSAAF